MESVGVRELRQNASVLLDRVASEGVSLEITNHGRAVARLVPIPAHQPAAKRADLIELGALRPGRGDVLDVTPVSPPPGAPTSTELLDELRADR